MDCEEKCTSTPYTDMSLRAPSSREEGCSCIDHLCPLPSPTSPGAIQITLSSFHHWPQPLGDFKFQSCSKAANGFLLVGPCYQLIGHRGQREAGNKAQICLSNLPCINLQVSSLFLEFFHLNFLVFPFHQHHKYFLPYLNYLLYYSRSVIFSKGQKWLKREL